MQDVPLHDAPIPHPSTSSRPFPIPAAMPPFYNFGITYAPLPQHGQTHWDGTHADPQSYTGPPNPQFYSYQPHQAYRFVPGSYSHISENPET